MNLTDSFQEECRVGHNPSQQMLERLGDTDIEAQLDGIRRDCLRRGMQQRAEEARAWLEFSRATTRFNTRIEQKGANRG